MSYNPDVHAGGEGTFVAAGVDWNVSKWNGKLTKTIVDITTTGDYDSATGLTYARKKATMAAFSWTAEAFRDGNNDFLTTIATSTALSGDISNVVLTSFTGHVVTMPKAIAESIDIDSGGVAGVTKLTVSGSNQGKFTIT